MLFTLQKIMIVILLTKLKRIMPWEDLVQDGEEAKKNYR
jgi:hypothetical protein